MKDFYCYISSSYCANARDAVIYWCHCRRDADIFQHIMHVRQLSYCSVKLRSSSVRTYGRPISPILILLIIALSIQDRVYQTPTQDVTDLRQCLVDTWSGFLQSIVDDEWRKRLQAWVDDKGGHFEHLL